MSEIDLLLAIKTKNLKLSHHKSADTNSNDSFHSAQEYLLETTLDIPNIVKNDIVNATKGLSIKSTYKGKRSAHDVNVKYTSEFLELEKQMFDSVLKISLRVVQLNRKLSCVDKKHKFITCMCCKVTFSATELLVYYAHLRSEKHYGSMDKECQETNPVSVLKQFIIGVSDTTAKCYPCDATMSKNNIKNHIISDNHKSNYTKCFYNTYMYFSRLKQTLSDTWYSIQYYACALCKEKFDYKIDFLQHLSIKHNNSSCKIFDCCIPCAKLWLGQLDSTSIYSCHSMHPTHIYLVEKKDFMVGCIPTRAVDLVHNSNIMAEELLVKCSKVQDNLELYNKIEKSLLATLIRIFPEIKLYQFGSRVSGLGFENSDIDIYIECEKNMYDGKYTGKFTLNNLKKAAQQLQNDESWEMHRTIIDAQVPIIKLRHKKTGIDCDLSFSHGLSVENSHLMRAYCKNRLCKKFILFVKRWLFLCCLSGYTAITNYALGWCVIFYLQTKGLLPTVTSLIQQQTPQVKFIADWRVCPDTTRISIDESLIKEPQEFKTLLKDFFLYYEKFDYRHNIICPLLGVPVSKNDFINAKLKDMDTYVTYVTSSKCQAYFRLDSAMCVQDPYNLSSNVTKAVSTLTVNSFRQYCGECARQLKKRASE